MSEVMSPEIVISDAPNLANTHAVVAEPQETSSYVEQSTDPMQIAAISLAGAIAIGVTWANNRFNPKKH